MECRSKLLCPHHLTVRGICRMTVCRPYQLRLRRIPVRLPHCQTPFQWVKETRSGRLDMWEFVFLGYLHLICMWATHAGNFAAWKETVYLPADRRCFMFPPHVRALHHTQTLTLTAAWKESRQDKCTLQIPRSVNSSVSTMSLGSTKAWRYKNNQISDVWFFKGGCQSNEDQVRSNQTVETDPLWTRHEVTPNALKDVRRESLGRLCHSTIKNVTASFQSVMRTPHLCLDYSRASGQSAPKDGAGWKV